MRRAKNRVGGYRGRRTWNDILWLTAVVLAGLVVLLLAVLFFGQRYIVYTDDGLRLDLPFFTRQEPEHDRPPLGDVSIIERPGDPGGVSDPVPEPEKPAMAALQLPIQVLTGDGEEVSRRLEQAGANAVVFEMKDPEGNLSWNSQQRLAEAGGVSSGAEGINDQLRRWNQGDVYTVARVCCFRDNTLPYRRNSAALRTAYGNWRDELELRWLDPANADVQSYLAGLCGELAELGFDEILLENCTFPVRGNLGRIVERDGLDQEALIQGPEGFLEQVRRALEPYGTVLSIRAEAELLSEGGGRGGLTEEGLVRLADRIWMERQDGAEELPERMGISEPEGRLVWIVPSFQTEERWAQAVFEEAK